MASERNVERRENATDAPMRNMNTGAAGGPPRKLASTPIGVVHVAGSPQWRMTWMRIMKNTARPRARSNAKHSIAGRSASHRPDSRRGIGSARF